MTLTSSKGHRVVEKLVIHSVVKLYEYSKRLQWFIL